MESDRKGLFLLAAVVVLSLSFTATAGLVSDSQAAANGISGFSISLTQVADASDVTEEFVKSETSSCSANCTDAFCVEIDDLSQCPADFQPASQITETVQGQQQVPVFSDMVSARQ
ncbi:MAG: hypothetical protein ACYSUT_02345 [Planctomycetota bacterium]|jgi:hypothetical protein